MVPAALVQTLLVDVGMAALATVTALGGGILRDVPLGITPPGALRASSLLLIPLVATVVTFSHDLVDRLRRAVDVTDAVGPGVFCSLEPAREHLRAVRRGEVALADVLADLATTSPLPPEPDRAWVDGWLHRSHLRFWDAALPG